MKPTLYFTNSNYSQVFYSTNFQIPLRAATQLPQPSQPFSTYSTPQPLNPSTFFKYHSYVFFNPSSTDIFTLYPSKRSAFEISARL